MPELAELKLTADYVNSVVVDRTFHSIVKNPEHKWKDIRNDIDFGFSITAEARGKELRLVLTESAISPGQNIKSLMMTMGMGGRFQWVPEGESVKHTHLSFLSACGGHLAFVDIRRFGKWNWGNWNSKRGPDPTTEYFKFCHHINQNLSNKAFDKPIFEILMDQRYFNGIGNYLRAEILYRIPHTSPFTNSREFIEKHRWELFSLCRDIPILVYEIGGGSIKDWKNPFGQVSSVSSFLLCYGNKSMNKILDSNGRTFWFDPKWKKEEYDK
jgi:endonuclease VIII-like 1